MGLGSLGIGTLDGALGVGARAFMTDAERERLIEAYRVALELEQRPDYKHAAVQRMRELIGERSLVQVREMEAIQGLG